MTRHQWTEQDVAAHLRKFKSPDRAAVSVADLEPDTSDAASPEDARKEVDQKFRIHFHSRRRRAIDPDGLYSKAAIDGLREGSILIDDNADVVSAVSYSQERAEEEETVIEVWEIKKGIL